MLKSSSLILPWIITEQKDGHQYQFVAKETTNWTLTAVWQSWKRTQMTLWWLTDQRVMSQCRDAAACWDVRVTQRSHSELLWDSTSSLSSVVTCCTAWLKQCFTAFLAVAELAWTSPRYPLNSLKDPTPSSDLVFLTQLSTRFRAMWQIPSPTHASVTGDCRLNSCWSVVAPGCPALSGNHCLWAQLPMVTRISTREQAVRKFSWCFLGLINSYVTYFVSK